MKPIETTIQILGVKVHFKKSFERVCYSDGTILKCPFIKIRTFPSGEYATFCSLGSWTRLGSPEEVTPHRLKRRIERSSFGKNIIQAGIHTTPINKLERSVSNIIKMLTC